MRNLERKPVPVAPAAPAGSLAAALARVPEPRQPYGWRPDYPPLPLVGLLQLIVAASLCGMRSLYAIAQWGRERQEDDPGLLQALGLPPGRSPCVATLHRLCKTVDVGAFEAALGGWLAETGVAPTEPVAVDGKTLRGIHGEAVLGVHLVGVYAHRAGAILAQLRTAGKGQELAAAKEVLAQVPLVGRLVTADALLTQREVAQQIVEAGGSYLLPVKENQPSPYADLAAAFSPLGTDGTGGVRPARPSGLVAGGGSCAGRAVECGDGAGAEGAAWTAGSADALAAGGPGPQRLPGQQRDGWQAVAGAGAGGAGGAAAAAGAAGSDPQGRAGGELRHHRAAAQPSGCGGRAPGAAWPLGD